MTDTLTVDRTETYAAAVAAFRREAVEALLAGNLETGVNACVECCDRHVAAGGTAQAIVDGLWADLMAFVGETPLQDDVTLLVVKRTP